MRRLPFVILLTVVLAACDCGTSATPANTEIINAEFREIIGTATLGDVQNSIVATRVAVIDPGQGAALDPDWEPVRIRVEVTHGPVEMRGEGEVEGALMDTPQRVRLVVEDSGKFEIVPDCDTEISRMAEPPGPNERGFVGCRLDFRRGGSNTIASFVAYGDGTVEVDPPMDGAVEYP
ncbi:MAG: hypothetical protein AAGF12_27220 [Myxococcota bacterium]